MVPVAFCLKLSSLMFQIKGEALTQPNVFGERHKKLGERPETGCEQP